MDSDIMLCGALEKDALQSVLRPYKLEIISLTKDQPLEGSYWGEPEAGLIGNQLFIYAITPVQSALHEACHYICMDEHRRTGLHTNAGGGYDEENAVCYLQILLADQLNQMGSLRMMQDMDHWGYTFRLGSARKWFEDDAAETRDWLLQHNLITPVTHTSSFTVPTGNSRN